MNREHLEASALSFGFDPKWVADILETWGEDVLAIVIELARNGFSTVTIIEILIKVGPKFLELIVDFINRKKSYGLIGDMVPNFAEGSDNAFADIIMEKYLPMILIERYLPLVKEKYGKQLLTDIILQNLQK